MRKFFRTLVLTAAIIVAFTSCKKDDSQDSAGIGSFTVDGITYKPSYGYLVQSRNSQGKNEFLITFSDASSVQGLIDQTNQIEMTLVIIPPSGTLDNGTYTGNATHQQNLIEAFVRLGNDTNDDVQWTITDAYTGSITVTKTDDIYDISYTFLAEKDGTSTVKTITGTFKGALTNVQQ
jgi:hypothetical protein